MREIGVKLDSTLVQSRQFDDDDDTADEQSDRDECDQGLLHPVCLCRLAGTVD